MTWIKTERPGPDNPALLDALEAQRALYPAEYGPNGGADRSRLPPLIAADSIVLSHSLIPDALRHAFSAFGAMMDPGLPLARRDHELIATSVSALNKCHY